MVSSGRCSIVLSATTTLRMTAGPCQRRVVRAGFRRCAGRGIRRSVLGGKSCPAASNNTTCRSAVSESTEPTASTASGVVPTMEESLRDSSSSSSANASIHAHVSACLDVDDRAASAAAGLLSRINAGMFGKCELNDKTAQLQTQDALSRNACAATLDDDEDDRAAEAAARFLARVHGNNTAAAAACSPIAARSRRCEAKRVRFDMAASVIHSVIPYSEVYGIHPREFVFCKDYSMTPAAPPHGFVGLDSKSGDDYEDFSDSDDSDDEYNYVWQ